MRGQESKEIRTLIQYVEYCTRTSVTKRFEPLPVKRERRAKQTVNSTAKKRIVWSGDNKADFRLDFEKAVLSMRSQDLQLLLDHYYYKLQADELMQRHCVKTNASLGGKLSQAKRKLYVCLYGKPAKEKPEFRLQTPAELLEEKREKVARSIQRRLTA